MAYDFYIRTKEDLIAAVEKVGILPYFSNSIPGFSLEEHCAPGVLFSDTGDDTWAWKGPVIRATGCAYGKFFEKKACYISAQWFPDFANYRRDGYDFDARYDDGLASYRDKTLFELIDANAPIISKSLKQIGNYRKGGNKGFDTIITRLQSQCYVVISDFVYMKDKYGKPYGWGVAEYSTPEHFMGDSFTDNVYSKSPEESYERLLEHFSKLFPKEDLKKLRKLLG